MLVLGRLIAIADEDIDGSGEHVSPDGESNSLFGLVAVSIVNCLVLPSSKRRCSPDGFLFI